MMMMQSWILFIKAAAALFIAKNAFSFSLKKFPAIGTGLSQSYQSTMLNE